ncbi:UDP-glucose/GDP-mannose dehydrogenase family protein [Streptomyces sp. ISL-36]|uniref:UDP-glucose dehydrogenase family protein n=1 Tax=Streptomyces sp. ISL-36 TaxID=2819182 RepID=UPI001BEBFCF3|nr:nucleotide sugar dehydrogenase [Streptomyces sp. ISL-36]MBT2439472.1 UDP-glucose/GDP-mannose dehydrogenase family protein [Streptomyces sp. ISL-36]
MRAAVVGQGYVGVTGAVALAQQGHRVVGVEQDRERLACLRAGEPPEFEPGLIQQMTAVLRTGRLEFVEDLPDAMVADPLDVVMICVGAPPAADGTTNLSEVLAAVEEAAELVGDPLVVLRSTVPPGTSDMLLAEYPELRQRFVCNPEFLNRGDALDGWQAPARIVAGAHHPPAVDRLRDLYRSVSCPWVTSTPSTAEMIKYASNAFLATKISFANELARMCTGPELNIDHVVQGVGLDPRIGPALLQPGTGHGDSCLPVDTAALSHWAADLGVPTPLIDATVRAHAQQPAALLNLLRESVGGHLLGLDVAVLGVCHEPWNDDLRFAPGRALLALLQEQGAAVRVWDPGLTPDELRHLAPSATTHAALPSAVAGAHAALVLTEWPQAVEADWADLAARMREPRVVVDAKNCLPPVLLHQVPVDYRGIGNRRPMPEHAATDSVA